MTESAPTTIDYTTWSSQIQRLDDALAGLIPAAQRVGVAAPLGQEWYDLLRYKLLPQVHLPPVLVVAVVGGTNIGKSAIFNHLAGENASAVSPLAAGTKHPVCLVPQGCEDVAVLSALFDGFVLTPWRSSEDATADTAEHHLYWRVGEKVPQRLLVMDTPDIDSDVRVNWHRATQIRQAADVLVAVLTQQKYNDAAVKTFFRQAVAADQPIVVVFNQVELEGDRDYWSQWLETFAQETGARPDLVYVVPYDRAGVAELRLPFYEIGPGGRWLPDRPSALRKDLASLHFDEIKVRTFRGAITQVLAGLAGEEGYLEQVRGASGRFAEAAEALGEARLARVQWPSLPPRILVDEIRDWWDAQRPDWSRRVHGFYRKLGDGLIWPVRTAWRAVAPPSDDSLRTFQDIERDTVVSAVNQLLIELDRLARVGNDILRARIEPLMAGGVRERLLASVRRAHAGLEPVDDDYRAFLREELALWAENNPRALRTLRSVDYVGAIARPAVTVSLVVSGWVFAGGVVHEAAVQAAGHTASHLATEVAITGGVAGGGEALVSGANRGLRHAVAQLFGRLQSRYAGQRAGWLADWIEREMLGDLLDELTRGAAVGRG
ncbi:MAG: GTPase domain-containing protein, partial [Planctomycetales bacterium]|nr:GTPase domain-containing protein [Planctomycetales bacterium]